MANLIVRVAALSLGLLGSSGWGQTLEVLHSFGGTDGNTPQATLTIGPDGHFYGTTTQGGLNGAGTIFRVTLAGEVDTLDHFDTATTGSDSKARLVNVGDGFLYGVTTTNLNVAGQPRGTVFRFDPANEELSVLFPITLASGSFPSNPRSLVATSPTTLHVLGYEPGGLWRIPLDGAPGVVTRNFDTSNKPAEGSSHRSIVRGSDGFLYGGSEAGGDDSEGILFRVAPDGTGFTRLHSCVSTGTGMAPIGAMVEGPDGNFYGTMSEGGGTNGVIFRITPDGEYTVLHTLKDLRYPEGDLMIASDGYLYGTAWDSGTGGNGNGGIFRIRLDGKKYEVLYTFETKSGSYPKGRKPLGGLVQGADGHLYGTTSQGGATDAGTIFRLKVKKLPPPQVNRAPVAVNDYVALPGSEAVAIDVTRNDFDPDGDTLLVSIDEEPTFGTAEVLSNGNIQYTPVTFTTVDSFTYKVSDGRGGISTALVTISSTPAGPLVVAGNYQGLMVIPDQTIPVGRLVISVNAKGKFTGTLYTQKKRVPLKGKFDENGTAVLSAKLPNAGRRTLFINFVEGSAGLIEAYVFADELWVGAAQQTIAATSEKKASYTVQIMTASEKSVGRGDVADFMPSGHGYGVVSIKPNGSVKMSGKLGDGTNLSWSSSLTEADGQTLIPIFAEPVKGGVFATLAQGTEEDGFEGNARWIRPAAKKPKGPYGIGFDGSADINIAPFTKPEGSDPVIDISDGVLVAYDGPIADDESGAFTIDGKQITVEAPLRKLKIDRKTGLFSGTIVVDGKPRNFMGAIDQTARGGLGHLSINGATGKVEMYQPVE